MRKRFTPSASAEAFKKCFDKYHQWGVPYCWVIDPNEGAAFKVHKDYGGLVRPVTTLTAGPQISLQLADIWAELERELHPF